MAHSKGDVLEDSVESTITARKLSRLRVVRGDYVGGPGRRK